MARWVPSGHLVYVRGGSLYAVAFDPRRLEVLGQPVPLSEAVSGERTSGVAFVAFSAGGALAYAPGLGAAVERKVILLDRKGDQKVLTLPPKEYRHPRFSPDGKRIALSIGSGRGAADTDVWIAEIATGALSRLTFGGGFATPAWSPDGSKIGYSAEGENKGFFVRAADGSGQPEILEKTDYPGPVADWSRDGLRLAFTRISPSVETWILFPGGGQKPQRLAEGANCVFSPDGRWIAYTLVAAGQNLEEVFVQPAGGGGGKWQVSQNRGAFPRWAGKEIFFISDERLMAAEVETRPQNFRAGLPRPLFPVPFEYRGAP